MPIVQLVILLFVLIVICVGTKYFVEYMEFPPPMRLIVLVGVGLVCLLLFLGALGLLDTGTGPVIKWR